jgi:hypothetical protein
MEIHVRGDGDGAELRVKVSWRALKAFLGAVSGIVVILVSLPGLFG